MLVARAIAGPGLSGELLATHAAPRTAPRKLQADAHPTRHGRPMLVARAIAGPGLSGELLATVAGQLDGHGAGAPATAA